MDPSVTAHDIFFYVASEGTCEDLLDYKPGGFHPIALGDILPKPQSCVNDLGKAPQYRVITKLGYGAFATVWLARDLIYELVSLSYNI
jgi:serine/threonine protein kinase